MLLPQKQCPGRQTSAELTQHDPPAEPQGPDEATVSQPPKSYSLRTREFILEPISDALVRVTFRQQQGYFGIGLKWNPHKPYTWSTWSPNYSCPNPEGLEPALHRGVSPDEALEQLCSQLLQDQQQADAASINPEERKKAAKQVLQELLQDLPQAERPILRQSIPD